MKLKIIFQFFLVLLVLSLLSSCAPTAPTSTQIAATTEGTAAEAIAANTVYSATEAPPIDTTKDDTYAAVLTFNNSAWNYDADNDVY